MAPIILNGIRGNVGVVVKETGKNRYKTHRILTPDGHVFEFVENEKEAQTHGVSTNAQRPLNTSSGNTIPYSADESKLSISDTDYMSAVERGDMDKAQKMVDEAAILPSIFALSFSREWL